MYTTETKAKNSNPPIVTSPVTLEQLCILNKQKAIEYINSLKRFSYIDIKHQIFN